MKSLSRILLTIFALSLPVCLPAQLLPSDNYAKTTVLKKAGKLTELDVLNATDQEKNIFIDYRDGLGRDIQTVQRKASPQGYDIILHQEYDKYGQQTKQFLPFVASTATGEWKSDAYPSLLAFYQANGDQIANDQSPFAQMLIEDSPLKRATEVGAQGSAWQPGTGHTTRYERRSNTVADHVFQWTASGPSGEYSAGELSTLKTTDENNNDIWIFTDKFGRVILTRSYFNEDVTENNVTDHVEYIDTYNVYDLRGNLIFQVPPKAVQKLKTGTVWSTTFRDSWIFVYTYDNLNRLISKKTPDKQVVYYCYDQYDRPVLFQDGISRAQDKWYFVKYDVKDRVILQGLYAYTDPGTAGSTPHEKLQNYLKSVPVNPSSQHENRSSTSSGYTNLVFPTAGTTLLIINYYDDYDFNSDGTPDWSYTSQGLPEESTNPPGTGFDKLTGSKRLVLGSSVWLTEYRFYDTYGRLIQIRSNNHLSSAVDNLATLQYNFDGSMSSAKTYHNAGNGRTCTVFNKLEYDNQGRLKKLFQKHNAEIDYQLLAQYDYNELGQLTDKKLHGTVSSVFLQSIDYRYTIRGWLSSINNASLQANSSNNDDANDLFGLELLYNEVETGLTDAPGAVRYNGNIAAVKWKGAASGEHNNPRSYRFTYDKINRKKQAQYQAFETAWNKEVNGFNESLRYDVNGNILELQRNGLTRNAANPDGMVSTIDNLIYQYGTGNQLNKIEDGASLTEGFKDGIHTTNEYTYDSNGSLASDNNKGVTTIVRSLTGTPESITFGDGRKVEYLYSAAGEKLTMKTFQGTTLVQTTDYVNGFVYDNGILAFFPTAEGRVVKNGNNLEYQYSINDHQGNSRLVFSSSPATTTQMAASFEGNAADGSTQYQNVNAANVVTFAAANHTASGSKVVRMNQSYKIGPSKSLAVYPGDQVNIEAWEYHEATSGYGTSGTPLTNLVTAIAAAFGGVSGSPGESGQIFTGVNDALNAVGSGGSQGNTRPAAYLNYILFNKKYEMVDMGWQLAPATTFNKQKLSFNTLSIEEPGYLFVYLSYEGASNNWVYFDDLTIALTPTNVVQYTEYYPFGMSTTNSWTRTNATPNNYLYNQQNELNSTTGLYETYFRGYDPVTGRFNEVDPLADQFGSWSPYSYAYNNPISFNDPTGASSWGSDDGSTANYGDPNFTGGGGTSYQGSYGNGYLNWLAGANSSGYGISNPGFTAATWSIIQTLWLGTPTGGTATWEPTGGYHYYNSAGAEMSGPGSTFQGHTAWAGHAKDITWRKDRNGNNISFKEGKGFFNRIFKPQANKFPDFQTLWSNYPHGITPTQHPSDNPLYVNQCAIRLSDALIKSGVSLAGYPEDDLDKDFKKWALTANRLKHYLKTNYPDYVVVTQAEFEKKYWNKTGIIFIQAAPGGIHHIDVFNKGKTGSGYYAGNYIWFWEIK
ncbi:T6SS effector amidase Tae4 family protein [Dawidia soli]|uniref:RHS repeat-associated core domain-containing protein n=1 Tax=Dawidia soli TaxID=2782352 RepID=A0AAP2DCW7_9BACT|nr:T6SS effector amidase Tae4 family protein [Dawidia soli]MBT1689428.1 RHS repeat-associated core domain-containing protein [Dawidia soli]